MANFTMILVKEQQFLMCLARCCMNYQFQDIAYQLHRSVYSAKTFPQNPGCFGVQIVCFFNSERMLLPGKRVPISSVS